MALVSLEEVQLSWHYFYTFMQSHLLEFPIYFLFYRVSNKSLGQIFLLVFATNALTHPWVFFGFMGVGLSYLFSVLISEVFAVMVEGHFQYEALKLPRLRVLLAATLANLFSWQVAPILSYFLFF
jgi:hypothetical protein